MKKRLLVKRVLIVVLGVFLLSLSNFLRIDKYYTETHFEKFLKVADGWNGTCYYNYSRSATFSNAAINVYK